MEAETRPSIELTIGVKRKRSRRNDKNVAKANDEFSRMRESTLKRDNYTCQGCGISTIPNNKKNKITKKDQTNEKNRPSGFFEIHHINDDHHDNRAENLITLCPFCHSVFTCGRRGEQFSGSLVWLPELSQAQLNRIAHISFAAAKIYDFKMQGKDSPWKEANAEQKKLYKSVNQLFNNWQLLENHAQAQTKELVNNLTSQSNKDFEGFSYLADDNAVETLYSVLTLISPQDYKNRHHFTKHLRIMPELTHYQEQVDYWHHYVWDNIAKPDTMERISQQMRQAIQPNT